MEVDLDVLLFKFVLECVDKVYYLCLSISIPSYSQLFGEPDADQDVSPDTEDPELQGEVSQTAAEYPLSNRLSTRQWAEAISYDPLRIFSKLFCDDIKYLLTMDKLWQQRSPPTPLDPSHLPEEAGNNGLAELQDQRIWTVRECTEVFTKRYVHVYVSVFLPLFLSLYLPKSSFLPSPSLPLSLFHPFSFAPLPYLSFPPPSHPSPLLHSSPSLPPFPLSHSYARMRLENAVHSKFLYTCTTYCAHSLSPIENSVKQLSEKCTKEGELVWDKVCNCTVFVVDSRTAQPCYSS